MIWLKIAILVALMGALLLSIRIGAAPALYKQHVAHEG
jgi:hypothetical protein